MPPRLSHHALALLLALAPLASARAAGILDHVPSNALGVALMRNLAATDAKIQQVEQIFAGLSEVPLVAPLAFAKAVTGLGAGLNESGDALLALLPFDESSPEPKPLLLVAVSDYAEFAEAIHGDASGEICRIVIAEQEVLLARRGDYAMLMNLEHRPTMEALLANDEQPSPVFAQLAPWLELQDIAVVVMPAAVDLFTAYGPASNAAQREALERGMPGDQFANMLSGFKIGFAINDHLIAFCNSEVRAAAAGLAIDDATNVRLSHRLLLKPSGALAAMEDVPKLEQSPLDGVPDEPFVFGGGGPLPRQWAEAFVRLACSMTKEARDLYGFGGFDDDRWKQVEESWRLSLTETADAVVMLAGDKDDPIVSNIYNSMSVENPQAYLAALRKSLEIWNGLTAQSTNDIKLLYELADAEVEGKPSLLVSADVAGAAGDEENPMMKTMWEAALGKGGKYLSYFIPTDATTVVASVGNEAEAAQAAKWLAANEQGLAQSPRVRTTANLLDPAAPWTLYVSPQGCLIWAERVYRLYFSVFGAAPLTIPAYPAGPPLGFSMNLADDQLQGEIVAPVQSLKDLAAYIKASSK